MKDQDPNQKPDQAEQEEQITEEQVVHLSILTGLLAGQMQVPYDQALNSMSSSQKRDSDGVPLYLNKSKNK